MNEIKIGDRAEAKKKFTIEDVSNFAKLTGDYNPIHLDEEYASKTIFKKQLVHGPLVITLITTLFANKLPGSGSVYLSHDARYLKPVFLDDEITAVVEVIDINEKQHIFVKTTCKNQNGDIVIDGIARLKRY